MGAYIGSMPEPTWWTRRARARRWPVAVGLGVALASACTGDDDTADDEPVDRSSRRPRCARGRSTAMLRIGLLAAPDRRRCGDRPIAQRGRPARRRAASTPPGGCLGEAIELIVENEGGDGRLGRRRHRGPARRADVDAVSGRRRRPSPSPRSSDLLAAGVLTCSPTATALALDDYPDTSCSSAPRRATRSRPRRSPSWPSRRAPARPPSPTSTTSYGRALAEATIAALRVPRGHRRGAGAVRGRPRTACWRRPPQIGDAGVGVVVIIGDAEHGIRLLSAIGEAARTVPGRSAARHHRQRRHAATVVPAAGPGRCRWRSASEWSRCLADRPRAAGGAGRLVRHERLRLRQPDRAGRRPGRHGRPGGDGRARWSRSAPAAWRARTSPTARARWRRTATSTTRGPAAACRSAPRAIRSGPASRCSRFDEAGRRHSSGARSVIRDPQRVTSVQSRSSSNAT